MSLSQRMITGVLWSSLAEVCAKVISPIVFLVLTRILSPADFGLVAIATTILMFVNVVSDLGTAKVIIQITCLDSELDKYCTASFWFNAILGLSLMLLIIIFSQPLANIFSQPNSRMIICVMSIQVFTNSLAIVQNSLRRRNLDFKFLFYLRVITIACPAIISVPVALLGGGVWAIVSGSVAGSVFSTVALWSTSKWKPSFYIEFDRLTKIFSLSIWNTLDQIFIWMPIALDTYLVSRYISVSSLGLYTTSRSLFTSISGVFIAPILPVLFASLAREIDDLNKFKSRTLISQKIIFSLSFFMALVIFSNSTIIENYVFTNQWMGISNVLDIVFVIMGFEYFYSALLESFRAKGLFKEVAINTIISISLTIPILIYSAQTGNILAYVIVRCCCLYIPYLGIFSLSPQKIGISFWDCILNNKYLLLIGCVSFPIVYFNKKYTHINDFVLSIPLLVLSFSLFAFFERDIIYRLVSLLTRKLNRK